LTPLQEIQARENTDCEYSFLLSFSKRVLLDSVRGCKVAKREKKFFGGFYEAMVLEAGENEEQNLL
jgi:hypothetical protein